MKTYRPELLKADQPLFITRKELKAAKHKENKKGNKRQ